MITIHLCVGSSCYVRGSDQVARSLQELIAHHSLEETVEIVGTFCLEHCSMGVTLQVDGQVFPEIYPETVEDFFHQAILPRAQGQTYAIGRDAQPIFSPQGRQP